MKAVFRCGMTLLGAGLLASPAVGFAQDAGQSAANPPATSTPANTVGPSDLQSFNLQGTVTRPAEAPRAVTARPHPEAPRTPLPPVASAPSSTPAGRPTARAAAGATQERPSVAQRRPESLRQNAPAASVTVNLSQLNGDAVRTGAAAAPSPGFVEPVAPPAPTLAPDRKLPLWPWLLAALLLGAGGAFLFWRNRSTHSYAGGPQTDEFTAPEAAPRPLPRPAPAPPSPPPLSGIVATRLRPWIDIAFQPLRCIVADDAVTIEFEIELFNSGSAPARAVLAEASLFNAGATQDQVIGAFFANPAGVGERIVSIPPLNRVLVRSQVVVPRSQVQEYELGGRKVFVPVIAFNGLYRWSSGEGQTSAAYLLGGDTGTDKLAPFKLDLGPRTVSKIAARPLPIGVRD